MRNIKLCILWCNCLWSMGLWVEGCSWAVFLWPMTAVSLSMIGERILSITSLNEISWVEKCCIPINDSVYVMCIFWFPLNLNRFYSSDMAEEKSESSDHISECGLCFENDELKRLPCNYNHIYCITCLTKDSERTKIIKCPLCRWVGYITSR